MLRRDDGTGGGANAGGGMNFSPDGRLLGIPEANGVVRLVDAGTGSPVGEPVRLPDFGPTWVVTFAADGSRMAIGGTGVVAVVDTASRQIVMPPQRVGGGNVSGFIDPTGSRVYSFGVGGGRMVVYDVDTAAKVGEVSINQGLALSLDGKVLAVGSSGDGRVTLYDTRDLSVIREAKPHNSTVVHMNFSPDGRVLATQGSDATGKVLDVATGFVYEPGFPVGNGRSRITPDGRHVLFTGPSGGFVEWSIDPEVWKARACELAGRNLTVAEWSRYLPNAGPPRPTCDQWPGPGA
jgi:WD40 repeat protein